MLELHNQDNFSIQPYRQMLVTFHLGKEKIIIFLATPLEVTLCT